MERPKLKYPQKENIDVMFIRVPIELKAHFKSYCAKRRTTMTNVLVQFMRERVNSIESIIGGGTKKR
jgi:hypothetical protein